MKETKNFYEVHEYTKGGSLANTTFYRLDVCRAEVEDGIAIFKRSAFHTTEVVLASSLCWSPEEAFKLHIARAKLRVSQVEESLDDAKRNLAKAERAEAQWRETGRETKTEEG